MSDSMVHRERRRVLAKQDAKKNRMIRNHNVPYGAFYAAIKTETAVMTVSLWDRLKSFYYRVRDFVVQKITKPKQKVIRTPIKYDYAKYIQAKSILASWQSRSQRLQ